MSNEHLAIYLNDHLAGANFAVELLDNLIVEASDLTSSLTALRMEQRGRVEALRLQAATAALAT